MHHRLNPQSWGWRGDTGSHWDHPSCPVFLGSVTLLLHQNDMLVVADLNRVQDTFHQLATWNRTSWHPTRPYIPTCWSSVTNDCRLLSMWQLHQIQLPKLQLLYWGRPSSKIRCTSWAQTTQRETVNHLDQLALHFLDMKRLHDLRAGLKI
jgi:hypothetical protein